MDHDLGWVVTGFGFLLAVLSFAVVFRGRRVPGDDNANQELEFRGLKVKTNAVVMLLVVSCIVAVLPISLQGWLASREPEQKPQPPVTAATGARAAAAIYITGQVVDAAGNPVKGATVVIRNMRRAMNDPGAVLASRITDDNGTFYVDDVRFDGDDRYMIKVVGTDDRSAQFFYIGPKGAVDLKAILVSKGREG